MPTLDCTENMIYGRWHLDSDGGHSLGSREGGGRNANCITERPARADHTNADTVARCGRRGTTQEAANCCGTRRGDWDIRPGQYRSRSPRRHQPRPARSRIEAAGVLVLIRCPAAATVTAAKFRRSPPGAQTRLHAERGMAGSPASRTATSGAPQAQHRYVASGERLQQEEDVNRNRTAGPVICGRRGCRSRWRRSDAANGPAWAGPR
jgi:hypothetical protein